MLLCESQSQIFIPATLSSPDRDLEPTFNTSKFQSSQGLSLHKYSSVLLISNSCSSRLSDTPRLSVRASRKQVRLLPVVLCDSKRKQNSLLYPITFYMQRVLEVGKGIQEHGQVKYEDFIS